MLGSGAEARDCVKLSVERRPGPSGQSATEIGGGFWHRKPGGGGRLARGAGVGLSGNRGSVPWAVFEGVEEAFQGVELGLQGVVLVVKPSGLRDSGIVGDAADPVHRSEEHTVEEEHKGSANKRGYGQ